MGLSDGGPSPDSYIEFADANVGSILAKKYGDGTGLTYRQAAAVTSFADWGIGLNGKSDLTSFNEINYFTGLQTIGHQGLQNTPNMVIDDLRLPSLVNLGGHAFQNSGVHRVRDLGYLSNLYTWDYPYSFDGCKSLEYIKLPDSLKTIGKRVVCECPALVTVDVGNAVTSIGEWFAYACKALQTLVMRTAVPPETDPSGFMTNVPATVNIYVPDEAVESYKAADCWSAYSARIKPLSDYVEP